MQDFEQRMEARKLREMDEQAEKQKALGSPEQAVYNATMTLQVVSHNYEMAKETLEIIAKHLEQFDDIRNVKGDVL